MKILCCLCFFLLASGWFMGTGLAGIDDVPLPQYSLMGALKVDRASFDAMLKDYPEAKLRIILVDEYCLTQMAAAMRAMEPYAITGWRTDSAGRTYSAEQQIDRNEYTSVLAQWVIVKRECWTTP
jgi:hypothetical protein